MNLTTEQMQAILDGAPIGETHYESELFQYESDIEGYTLRGVHALSDLREILTLRQRVQELEKRLQKKRSTIDVSLGDLEQLLKHARHFSEYGESDVFTFDLVGSMPFISPSLKNKEANYVCYRAIIRRDYHFGWVARFELKEQDDE